VQHGTRVLARRPKHITYPAIERMDPRKQVEEQRGLLQRHQHAASNILGEIDALAEQRSGQPETTNVMNYDGSQLPCCLVHFPHRLLQAVLGCYPPLPSWSGAPLHAGV
jgi:hypothetical protein